MTKPLIDQTNYVQSLMHMIKGNLGAGMLAMAKTFSHAGLVSALLGLPFICLINVYCVHALVCSCERLDSRLRSLAARRRFQRRCGNDIPAILGKDLGDQDQRNSYGEAGGRGGSSRNSMSGNQDDAETISTAASTVELNKLNFQIDGQTKELPISKLQTTETPIDNRISFEYSDVAQVALESGPAIMRNHVFAMKASIVGSLLLGQFGVCCVYLVFVADNLVEILRSQGIELDKHYAFAVIFPLVLGLSLIKTLRRLSIASACANALQTLGVLFIIEYLVRSLLTEKHLSLPKPALVKPIDETCMAFASAMFAFEGISVVIPVYTRLANQRQMTSACGITNVSYITLLMLYTAIGLLGYLRFGNEARDSITLNLPSYSLYDAVRAMFATSILLSYPLQFYVLNELIWNFVKKRLETKFSDKNNNKNRYVNSSSPQTVFQNSSKNANDLMQMKFVQSNQKSQHSSNNDDNDERRRNSDSNQTDCDDNDEQRQFDEQINQNTDNTNNNIKNIETHQLMLRIFLVVCTFAAAILVPKLNFLMDLVGSISATLLCTVIPATVHLITFWRDLSGKKKVLVAFVDIFCILFGLIGGVAGLLTSLMALFNSFNTKH